MNLISTLEGMGLRRPEAQVYLAAVELGEATAAKIAEKAQLKRPSVYVLLDELTAKGLISSVSGRGVAHFTAQDPRTVVATAMERMHILKSALPELEALAKRPVEHKPSVRFYEGISGIQSVLEDTITTPNTTILKWSDPKLATATLGDYYAEHIKERVSRNVFIRSVLENNETARLFKVRQITEKRDVRIVPEKYNFNDEITVYGDKVAIVSYKDLVGLIIENKLLAETMRNLFELTWERAGELDK